MVEIFVALKNFLGNEVLIQIMVCRFFKFHLEKNNFLENIPMISQEWIPSDDEGKILYDDEQITYLLNALINRRDRRARSNELLG